MFREKRLSSDRGWTLLEIVVVVGIVASLCAVGIPVFTAYKVRSFDARAKNDLVSASIAQETYYIDWSTYSSCASTALCDVQLSQFEPSDGVQIGVTSATSNYFVMTASHPKGSTTFTWDSNNKGLQE
jgi:Tfp pilus assembly protein PilE